MYDDPWQEDTTIDERTIEEIEAGFSTDWRRDEATELAREALSARQAYFDAKRGYRR